MIPTMLSTRGRRRKKYPPSIFLGKFDTGVMPEINPGQSDPAIENLWGEYLDANHREVTLALTTAAARGGTGYGLESTMISTLYNTLNQLQLYTYKIGYGWYYLRELLYMMEGGTWTFNKYNRMRVWIKTPPELDYVDSAAGSNFQIANYIRRTTGPVNSAESDNGHFYNYYNIPYSGEWHQIIYDWHPHHQRGAQGSTEHYAKPYPTSEPGYNWFDLMTRFYMSCTGTNSSFPATFMADDIELYHDPNDENVEEIYSLHGVYIPGSNTIHIGWSRLKTNDSDTHEVRYAFQSVHKIGWAAATPAPNGINPVGGSLGANRVKYATTAINVSGQSKIYMAVKPQNSSRFREIEIPL